MKKIISLLISVCLVFTMLASGIVTASAEGNLIEGTSITWSFNAETGVLSFEGEGAIPDYSAPLNNNGDLTLYYPWKNLAFTSIQFGEGITGIGNYAFCYSDTLKSVEIPDTITVLGERIFYRCENLETVKMPSEVTEVSESLFSCSGIKNITFGAKTEAIAFQAFYKCSDLETITFPSTLKTIGEDAFSQCTSLKSIVIPEGVTSIESYAFYACESLAEVALPSTLESLGINTFDGCRVLKEISFPAKLTVIPDDVCSGCTALTSVTLADTTTEIGDRAFNLCTSLKEITVPASVKIIGEKSFGYGKSDKKIEGFTVNGYMNSAAKSYADYHQFTFNSLGFVTSGTCGENATWEYNNEDKTLYINGTGAMADYSTASLPVYAPIPYEKVVISEGITKLGAYAFYGAKAMDFAISENVTEIGEKAIGYAVGADGIETVTAGTSISAYAGTAAEAYATANSITFNEIARPLPTEGTCGENVTWKYNNEDKSLTLSGTGDMADYSLDNPAPYNVHPYENVILGKKITKIGAYAFYGSKAANFAISEDVTEIGEKAIGYSVGEDGTEILTEGVSIMAYEGTAAQRYATENNITFLSLGEIPYISGVCGDNAIWTYTKADKTLVISGTGAVNDCKPAEALPEFANLEIASITVAEGITSIGDYALCTFKPYASITLGKSVMEIGKNAFGIIVAEVLGEDGQPTGEYTFTNNEDFTVNGYIVTPADEYAAAYGFRFNALDAGEYPQLSFGYASIVDYAKGFIFLYAKNPSVEASMTGFPTDNFENVTAPEKIATGSALTLKDTSGEHIYKFIVIGDANSDGAHNSTDALVLLKHSVGAPLIEDECELAACDINNDGNINSTDALIALQISVNAEDVISAYYDPGFIG